MGLDVGETMVPDAVEKRIAKMLRDYAANVGLCTLGELSQSYMRIVVTRDGGVGVAGGGQQPRWLSYAYTSELPALLRLKRMVEAAGENEPDRVEADALREESFKALMPVFAGLIAGEACAQMVSMNTAMPIELAPPQDLPPPAAVGRQLPDDPKRPGAVTFLIWIAWAAAVMTAGKVGGVPSVLLVAGLIGVGVSRNWGAELPNVALAVGLPIFIVVAVVASGAADNVARQAVRQYVGQIETKPPAPVPAPQPADDEWNRTALAFEAAHSDIGYGVNAVIMQRTIDALAKPGMSANETLQAGYDAARLTPEWTAFDPSPHN